MLHPEDIGVLVKLALDSPRRNRPLAAIGVEMGLSPSQVSLALKRAHAGRLVSIVGGRGNVAPERYVDTTSLLNLLVHAVRHIYPAKRGGETRGIPTGPAHALANELGAHRSQLQDVWPDPNGPVRGLELTPLFNSAPIAAAKSPQLHQALALIDSIRIGSARELELAVQKLGELVT